MRLLIRLLLLVSLAGLACGPASSETSPPATQARSAVSGTAELHIHYPAGFGHHLTVHCGGASGSDWTTPLPATWSAGDVWIATVSLSSPTDCKPLYDDLTWAIGPNWSVQPGQTQDLWPHFFHTGGRLQVITGWYSHALQSSRNIRIYFPPSYDENWHEQFPVVYMHDGQNLFDDSTAFGGTSWNIAATMDQGSNDGTIREAIVVGIDNTSARIPEYTPVPDPSYGGGNADAYLDFILHELKPQIDQNLRTFPDAAHTAMMGSSLGGLVSLYAGLRHPDVFALVGALSPSTWWDNAWVQGQSEQDTGPFPARLYLDSGDTGDSSNDDVKETATLAQAWQQKPGLAVKYWVQQGASHNEYWWRQRAPVALAFLLGGR